MNLENLCKQVVSETRCVGAFIKQEGQKFDASKIEHKGFNDLVSYVDKEAEKQLVDALKKKQYPALISNSSASDKLYRVQVGPYSDIKDAEVMRTKLVGDGYNPILKK